jgi:DNA polymerase-3 subunit delta'
MHQLAITGQDRPLTTLLKAWRSGAIPHSFLFTGTRGTGKFTAALWFASLLVCDHPKDEAPCGECPSCRKVHSSNHPDVRVTEPDRKTLHLKIDQIRALQREALYMPSEGARKIFIIDDAHRMNDAAANCLLKMLEEPPKSLHCILISPTIYSLLPTVISRCQIIRFLPVPAESIRDLLLNRNIAGDRASIYAHLAQGSAGKAVAMAEKETLWESRKKTLTLLAKIPSLAAAETLLAADSFSRELEDIEILLEFTLLWLRDLLLFKETGAHDYTINRDLVGGIENNASLLSQWQIVTCITYAREALEQLRSQVTPALVLERLFLSLHKVQSAPNYA